jgi:hypothetical protein
MADEIRMNLNVNVSKASASFDKQVLKTNKTFTQTGVGGPSPGRVSVPTSDTVISLAGLTTPGLVCITNHDTANYVEFGPTSAGAIVKMIKVPAGQSAVFYLAASVVLRGIANTGACVCSIDIIEA